MHGFREIDPYNISNSQRKAGIYSRKAPNFAVGNICMIVITTSIETKVLSKENLFIKEFTGIFRLEIFFFLFF